MKIFIICCLLFIHVNMCIFIRGFRVSIRVSGIRGFGFGDGFPPESVSDSGFNFGFRFWVHGDSTRSEPDPLSSLVHASTEASCEHDPWLGVVCFFFFENKWSVFTVLFSIPWGANWNVAFVLPHLPYC